MVDYKDDEDAILAEEENDLSRPSSSPASVSDSKKLKLMSEVFQQIEQEGVEVAEMLFDYLIDVSDLEIITGTIKNHKTNKEINRYISILNHLFKFSRKGEESGFRIISRKMIYALDKKTYIICMCFDGGSFLDVLCDVVNSENGARTPNSAVKITVIKKLDNSLFQDRKK